jgi:hypothetical protein
MLDPQRFARGLEPDEAVLKQVMVRRLKDEVRNPDGPPRFAGRRVRAIEVVYTPEERKIHRLLGRYLQVRRGQAAELFDDVRSADLVSLLLKKRLFSSPVAFAHTLRWHAEALRRRHGGPGGGVGGDARAVAAPAAMPAWLGEVDDWDDEVTDDVAGAEAEQALHARVAAYGPGLSAEAAGLLDDMLAWVDRHSESADSKATRLIGELEGICRPGGVWNDERVIVFTEYVDTQRWLADILDARRLGGGRLGLLFGGMDERRREHLKAAFQASPGRSAGPLDIHTRCGPTSPIRRMTCS